MSSTAISLEDCLREMVAIPSVNPNLKPEASPGGEASVCQYLSGVLRDNGFEPQMSTVSPDRPNLYCHWDEGKPETIILTAHTDTVPADDWEEDPFRPELRPDSVWGRGSCDTKASLTVFLAAFIQAARSGNCPYNLIFAAVCDEEAGFTGSLAAARTLSADLAIVGEPTCQRVIFKHKGAMRFRLIAAGRSCHSSTPQLGENAIYALSQAVLNIRELATRWEQTHDPHLGARTLSVTTISGGQAVNVIPDRAIADVDIRLIPGDNPQKISVELQQALVPGVTLDGPYLMANPLSTDPSHPLASRLAAISGQPFAVAAYATDAASYSEAGIPAVVFGPGDIRLAHTHHEHIQTKDLYEALGILMQCLTG